MKEINQALAHEENERRQDIKKFLYDVIWLVGMQKKT